MQIVCNFYLSSVEFCGLTGNRTCTPGFLAGSCWSYFQFFVLSYYVSLRSQFRVVKFAKTMFGSSLHRVVCGRAHFLWEGSFLVCTVCVCVRIVVYNRHCAVFFVLFVFILCFVYPMLPVSLECPFVTAPSVFSNVYLQLQ